MFQNITQDINQEDIGEIQSDSKKRHSIKRLFSIQDIILYAMSFMLSMVSFGDSNLAPFGLAIFVATCSNKIPAGIVYAIVSIGTLIKFGVNGFLSFLITSLIFIAMILIFRPKEQDESRNEKKKLGLFLAISTFIVQASKMFFTMFLFYDLLTSIALAMITYIFYKIFANSIVVIKEYGIKKAFSIEEVMGASLLIAIAISSFKGLNVFSLSISNILSIMLVLFLGWKNGMLVGATSGITIGMVVGIISNSSPILIASYAISGLLSGLLNRLGKIGVIVGFCVGNAILTYFFNGNTVPIITIREILIASLGLLAIPKNIDIDISDIIGKTKFLPVTSDNRLDGEKETIYKLNTVSKTISDMAESYNEVAYITLDSEDEIEEQTKKSFIEELYNNIDDLTDNIIYDDIIDPEENFLDCIYKILETQEEITREDIIKTLEENNNYIIGLNNDERKSEIEQDLDKMVKTINHTYRINKLNVIWKQKEANNKKTLANQLGGVSKVISSLAEDIEHRDEEVKKKKQKFEIQIAISKRTKKDSEVSGDTCTHTKLQDNKYMLAISDGMGSGERAKNSSNTVIKMLERLLKTGFDKDVSIGLINSAVSLNSESETYATIDISVIDLINGNIEFVKNGACPTYIKKGNKVEIVKAVSFPAGILDKIDLVIYDKDLLGGEIIVMCSDGILESNIEYNNKELWIKDTLESIETNDVQKIAELLIQESIDNGFGVTKDDMTVIVAKLCPSGDVS